ncbi:MAG TPA: tetratricopeptide repeat protein [Silvibacterium sp.]|nr:tetratricopeptide repeat protein [Silvibacterium sp.]
MRTIYQMSAATPRSWFVALIAVCTCVPGVSGQGPNDRARGGDSAVYGQGSGVFLSDLDIAQDSPTKTGTNSPTQVASINSPMDFGQPVLSAEMQGDLMMVHQRYLAAVSAYQRGDRNSAVLWNKLGIAYQHLYALDFAKAQYEKALFLNPKYAEALNNLGTVFYGEKDYHKAEKYYRKALRIKPDCASFYSNLGTAYFSERKYKEGMAAYQHAFSIDPDIFIRQSQEQIAEVGPMEEQAKLNYALAKLYAQAGNLEAAIQYLRSAFIDGFDDRKKLMGDKEFASIRDTPQFHLLLAEEHLN